MDIIGISLSEYFEFLLKLPELKYEIFDSFESTLPHDLCVCGSFNGHFIIAAEPATEGHN